MRYLAHLRQRRDSIGSISKILFLLVLTLSLAWPGYLAQAQTGAGSIQGTVTDSTGAAIPNARIEVKNVATGVTSNTTSSSVGFYQVPDLFTGTYAVTVSFQGMKTYNTSIELLVGQTAVINPALTPGAVTQQVTVNADSVQLTDTESGTLATTLENSRIDQIPMNGRLLLTLTLLTTPGMEGGGQQVNGLEAEATSYLIDGVSTIGTIGAELQTANTQITDPDAIQEVRVETENSSAAFASPSTTIVTTKSGTNGLHGSLFETARNNALGLARRIQDPVNFAAPHLVRNEFGASAGGPIILPHVYHGKDKSFWFFAYERYSLAQITTTTASVPTLAMRQGNFSGLVNTAGNLQVIYDPSTTKSNATCPVPSSTTTTNNLYCRTAFSNNAIPSTELSPLGNIYYQTLPQPTTAADPLVDTNMAAGTPSFTSVPQYTIRLDHVFSDKNSAYLRFSNMVSNEAWSGGSTVVSDGTTQVPRSNAVGSIPAGAGFGYLNAPSNEFLAGIGFTHIFSPTFFAQTVLSQAWYGFRELNGFNPDLDYEKLLNIPNNFGETGFPFIGSGQLMFSMGTSQQNNVQDGNIISTVQEDLTKTVGKHQMEFGGLVRHERDDDRANGIADNVAFGPNPDALYNPTSGASYSAYANTGDTDTSMYLGSAASYTVDLQPPHIHYHAWQMAAYIQDNYHISRNLTANIGVRWQAMPALWTKYGMANTFDLKNDADVLGTTPANLIAEGYTTQAIITNDENIGVKFETAGQAGLPSKLMKDYDFNFYPRLGLSYQLFGGKWGTVVRGSYGRYAEANPIEDDANKPERNNPLTATYSQSYATAAQAIDDLPNEYLRYNGPAVFGVAGSNTANAVNTTSTTAITPGISLYSPDSAWAPTVATETNFTIEQPFKGHSVLRASYVWTHATNDNITMLYNHQPTLYQWEMATGTVQPTGGASVIGTPLQNTYSATAMGPYDQTTWGNSTYETRAGWSNYNALQVNYQRLFHHGYAYQLTYAYSKSLRAGGDQLSGYLNVDPLANFPGVLGTVGTMTSPYGPTLYPGVAPPALPANTPDWASYHNLIKYEEYQRDSQFPTMHTRFSWIVDLPVGRGKRFLGNSNRFVNEIVGGFQLAGDGNFVADLIQPTAATQWGAIAPLQIYKHKYPLTDCTSGVCYKEFLWFNGYQAPSSVSGGPYGTCLTNCITGMPANYQPDVSWVDNTPGTTYYQTNDVVVTLKNGTKPNVPYDAGPMGSNYLQKTWIHGPVNWPMDASLFKVFPITEKINLRVNVDAFNVFNMPGENDPGTGGLQKFLTSFNQPRQLQITARLTF